MPTIRDWRFLVVSGRLSLEGSRTFTIRCFRYNRGHGPIVMTTPATVPADE